MKPYYLLIATIICSIGHAQWKWSNPQPTGYINSGITFTDSLNGFIVNYNGDLLRTTDQGINWAVQQNLPGSSTINYKDSTAVIGAIACVYVSTDMGQTWTKKTINQSEVVNKVQVINRDTIFIVSTNVGLSTTHFFVSVNRGNSWQEINTNLTIKSVWMIDSHEGFATSYNGIYKTTDGGLNWQKTDTTIISQCTYIKFKDRNNGFAYSQAGGGQLLKTVDGGQHWIAYNSTLENINSIEFIDQEAIVAISDEGIIYRSPDNGDSWQPVYSDQHYLLYYDVHFVNKTTGFIAAHSGGILKTTDGGLNWTLYSPTHIDVEALNFSTNSIGFAATWNNLYTTIDTGSNWTPLGLTTLQTSDRWRYIHFFNKDTGIVVSETPIKIFKTYNGGINWQPINLNILYADNFLASFSVDQTVFLSTDGAYGKQLLHSVDAGETWSTQYVSNGSGNPYFSNLFFTDAKTGYGTYGYYVYKSLDSGKTWNPLTMPTIQLLKGVWFSGKTGYAIGDQSYITKTNDSGHTWNQLYIDPTNNNVPGDLTAIKFFNNKIGFVTSGKNIYETKDAGNNWNQYGTFPWDIKGIELTSDSTIYVYGNNGSILKRSIPEFSINSVKVDSIYSCKGYISAIISASLSSIDSIWFQYGVSAYDSIKATTPFSITDTSLNISVLLSNLLQGTSYKGRFRISYKNNYYYSDSITFTSNFLSTPSITFSNGILYSSSAQGNQWYLNDTLIVSATQTSFTPIRTGSYTVNLTVGGCTSAMSAPYVYDTTHNTNPPPIPPPINPPTPPITTPRPLTIFPNPVQTSLNIQNDELKNLEIDIYNSLGIEIIKLFTSKKDNLINMQSLPSGIYLINAKEISTSKSTKKMILKL